MLAPPFTSENCHRPGFTSAALSVQMRPTSCPISNCPTSNTSNINTVFWLTLAPVFGHIVNFAVIIFWPLLIPIFSRRFPCATGQGLNYAPILSMRKMGNLSLTPPCMSSGTRRSKPHCSAFCGGYRSVRMFYCMKKRRDLSPKIHRRFVYAASMYLQKREI
jgi:hypothetical protein